MARYHPFSSCGEKDGVIRVDDFKQACVMQSDGKVDSKGMEYAPLLGLSMPIKFPCVQRLLIVHCVLSSSSLHVLL